MTFLEKVVEVAKGQVGVRETSRNRGPQVDEYLEYVGIDPTAGAFPWCAAFVGWVFGQAAYACGIANPLPRSASVLKLWQRAATGCDRFTAAGIEAKDVPVGAVFCIDHGGGKGHTGIVTGATDDGALTTIEGNTAPNGTREGDGVYARTRTMTEITLGFISAKGDGTC